MTSREVRATECLDAIRMAVDAASDDKAAVMVIRTILADAPPVNGKDTNSVRRLVRAIKKTRYARWTVPQ